MSNTNLNDVYTLCDMLTKAYLQAVTYSNIVNGFQACGLWDRFRCAPNPEVIKKTDITNLGQAADQSVAYKKYIDLLND